jgi:hypothetical protein
MPGAWALQQLLALVSPDTGWPMMPAPVPRLLCLPPTQMGGTHCLSVSLGQLTWDLGT